MKADKDRSSEGVWMFLHGELDAASRDAFEREMAADPELRKRVDEARGVDRLLRELLPALEASDGGGEAVAEQALAAWEGERSGAASAVSQPSPVPLTRPRWSRRARSASVWLAGLAAAAALVVAVNSALWETPGARWTEPAFSPLALRGAGELSGPRAIDAGSARRCHEALKAAVAGCAAERGITLPSGLTFSFRMQELRDGAFSVAVQARTRKGATAGEWFGDYSSVDAFLGQVKASALRMVEAVVPPSQAEGGGVRP